MFLARSFAVLEPVLKSDVVVTVPQSTGATGQKLSSIASSKMGMKKATQPIEAPGAVIATRPVEAPGASAEFQPTGQDASPVAADSPEVQPPGPACSTYTGGRPEVQPPGPTLQTAFDVKKHVSSTTDSGHPADEPFLDTEQFSDHTLQVLLMKRVRSLTWSLMVQIAKS